MHDSPGLLINGRALFSERFGDGYAGRADPVAEKRFVFCAGNDLARRFAAGGRLVVGELGFGAGLSFLVTLALWREVAPPDAELDFVSVERFPLQPSELAAALAAFPELESEATALQERYPVPLPGRHRLDFESGRLRLTLIVDEAMTALRGLDTVVDAWFLDGFAPSRNPDMWRAELLREVARKSHPGTTFATYTAAAQVRRDLEAVGFAVEKRPGFAGKRERLLGALSPSASPARPTVTEPWFMRRRAAPARRAVIVVGGGLAGTAAASRLAARGYRVTLLERGATLAAECSANPAAVLYPYLTRDDNAAARLSRLGFQHTEATLRRLAALGFDPGWHPAGLADLAVDAADLATKRAAFAALGPPPAFARWIAEEEARSLTGWPAPLPGIWYPNGGWVEVPKLCAALIAEHADRITMRCNTEVLRIEQHDDLWCAFGDGDSAPLASAPTLVLANGSGAQRFAQTAYLPLVPNRGQLSGWRVASGLRASVSHTGYFVADGDRLWLGSTNVPGSTSLEISGREHRRNLDKLAAIHPALMPPDIEHLDGWCGVRATTADHLPLVGEVVDADTFAAQYAGMARGERACAPLSPPSLPGLYVLAGLGSRALACGLLAAELVAALVHAEPLPVDPGMYRAVHPSRFLIRGLKRARRGGANVTI